MEMVIGVRHVGSWALDRVFINLIRKKSMVARTWETGGKSRKGGI